MIRPLALILLFALSAACERSPAPGHESAQSAPASEPTVPALSPEQASQFSLTLWQRAGDSLVEFTQACNIAHASNLAFLEAPTDTHLQAAQERWQSLHEQWLGTAPVTALADTSPDLFAELSDTLAAIDAYPIAAGYLDAVQGYPFSGIVNDITLDINRTNLREQHGLTSSYEASLGLHVLEFLLFGEQGERQAGDYTKATAGTDSLDAHDRPENRRRELLRLVSRLLCDDASELAQRWQSPGSESARIYNRLPPDSRLQLWRRALVHAFASTEVSASHCEFASNCPTNPLLAEGVRRFIQGSNNGAAIPLIGDINRLSEQLHTLAQLPLTEPTDAEQTEQALLEAIIDTLSADPQTPGQTPLSDSSSRQSPDEPGDPAPDPAAE